MTIWQATVSFEARKRFDDDAAFDLIEALLTNGAAVSVDPGHKAGAVTLTVRSADVLEATERAASLVIDAAASAIGSIQCSGIEVLSKSAANAALAKPLFPEVVGYAEIAEMAGVSRQRARQFAALSNFPAPVIETAQGPLMGKHAVKSWLEHRNTAGGRPRKELTSA